METLSCEEIGCGIYITSVCKALHAREKMGRLHPFPFRAGNTLFVSNMLCSTFRQFESPFLNPVEKIRTILFRFTV